MCVWHNSVVVYRLRALDSWLEVAGSILTHCAAEYGSSRSRTHASVTKQKQHHLVPVER